MGKVLQILKQIQSHPPAGCDECKLRGAESYWGVPFDFNYTAKFLFILDQYHPSLIKKTRKTLEACGWESTDIEFAFTSRCWQDDQHKAQLREGQKCRPLLDQLLLKISKSTILIPMGATPCKLVGANKSIQTAHGTISHDAAGRMVIPTFHPSQVVAYPESMPAFIADLEVIKNAGKDIFAETRKTNYMLANTLPKFRQLIAEMWLAKYYAVDIEATSLDPFRSTPHKAAVLGVSFSAKPTEAWFLPIDHPDHVWNVRERTYIVKMLKVLLEAKHNRKIFHNGKYDIKYLRKVLGIHVAGFDFDTLMAHYVAVSEVSGTHGLKILAWEFTDMGGYDDALDLYKQEHPEADPDKGGHYGNIPLDIIWPYAAADADCTLRLYVIFEPKIAAQFSDLFYNIVMPSVHSLANVEYEGVPIDRDVLAEYKITYPILLAQQLDRLREFSEVIQLEKTLTQAAIARKRYERVKRFRTRSQLILQLKATDPDKAAMKLKRLEGDIAKAKLNPVRVAPITFNPASPDQVVALLYDSLGFKHNKKTKTGERCADKEVLKDWWFEYKHPILMAIGKYKKLHTVYGMFVRYLEERLGDDGRIRGSYNAAGTETGRLSMSDPNLQQIPKNLKADVLEPFVDASWPSVKKLFAAIDAKFAIMQFDYSQAELRWLAAVSRDPILIDAYQKGQDLHARVAAEIYHILIELVDSAMRAKAKVVNFGLLYGQGVPRLAASLGISLREAEEFIKAYFDRLKKVKKWINATKKRVRETGESWSPYGRLRRLMAVFSPDQDIVAKAERQGVNSPIQSAASDCTLMSVSRIDTWLRAKGLLSRIVITVHDSIILLVYLPEAVRVYNMVKKIMENPKHNGVLDGVPFVADAEMGKSWGRMLPIKEVADIQTIYNQVWLGKAA